MGAGLGKSTALITDGRFSGASRGFIIGEDLLGQSSCSPCFHSITDNNIFGVTGHVVPEAREGRLIFLLASLSGCVHNVPRLTLSCFPLKVVLLRS